jgi:hypothetical protein
MLYRYCCSTLLPSVRSRNQIGPKLIGVRQLLVCADNGEERNTFWILVGNPEGTGPLGMRYVPVDMIQEGSSSTECRMKRNLTAKTKLRGLSPRVNYTDRATAACRRS